MEKKGWMILLAAALIFISSTPGWSGMTVASIPGLELSGYIRNQTDIRAGSPQDIMRCDTNMALRADYKPNPSVQFYLELRPFVDGAYDMSGGLNNRNRGVMGIDNSDYAWHAKAPKNIGSAGTQTEVGGWVKKSAVLSTNMNTSYWLQNSFLREAWFLWKNPCWQVKIGKQIVTWGETDGLKLLDMVNATDYRHFIIDDMEDSKIPEYMTNITYYFNNDTNLQFLWIPWYVPNNQAPAGSAWAFNGVNLIYFYDHFDALGIVRSGGPLIAAKTACTIDYNNPKNENEFGLRFKGVIGTSTDFTLNYFYTHQKNNVFIIPNGMNPLQPFIPGTGVKNDVFQFTATPHVQHIYGLSFNHVFGKFLGLMNDLVMRGEGAYYYQNQFFGTYQPFNYTTEIGPSGFGLSPGGDLFIDTRDLIRTSIGFDKNVFWLGLNWLMSAQVFWEHIVGYPETQGGRQCHLSNVGLTKAYPDEITWTYYFNTDIMNERIKFDNLFVWEQMQNDGWNRFKVGFDISDHWSLWLGNNFFWGRDHQKEINPFVGNGKWFKGDGNGPANPDSTTIGNIRRGTPFGEYSRNTSFFAELKWSF